MADLTKIINIRVDFGKGKIDIDGVTSSLNKLNQAEQNLSKTLVGAVQPAYKRTEQAIRDQITYQRQLQKAVEITSFEYVQHQRTIEGLQKELSTFQGQNAAVSGGFNNMRNNAGLASQTLVEVGRTISDANYGFTAVANNLSQLGYYFVTLVDQSKGFGNAVKSLGKQFLGAGGLIVAFQLVIFLIERYTMSQREAKRETEELGKALGGARGQIAILKQYQSILDSTDASSKEHIDTLRRLKKDGYDKLIGATEDYIKAKSKLLLFNVAEKQVEEELAELFAKRVAAEKQILKEQENLASGTATVITQSYGYSASAIDNINKQAKKEGEQRIKNNIDSLEKEVAEIDKQTDKTLKTQQTYFEKISKELEGNPFFCLFFGDCSKKTSGGAGGARRDKFFRERLFEVAKLEEKYRQQSLKDERTTAEELISIEKRAALSRLEIDYNLYLEREKVRYEEYVKTREAVLKNDKATKAQKEQAQRELLDAEATYNREREEALKSFGAVVKQINKAEKNEFEILERQKSIIFQGLLDERKSAELASVVALATNDLNRIDAGFALEQEKTAQKIALIEQEKEIRLKAGQDTFIQDQQIANETEALNQKRLLAFEAGERAKLAIANQVGEAIIAIAGEGSAIGKAVAVAMATMNTYEAVTAALGSKPYGPWNIAQAAAVAAMGFVQVRNILKTQVPSPKGGAGGGAAAAPSIQPPDFNIVGQSASNQLASAVQGQFNQPVKAYVVSKDVSTAQEMDRNIVSTASLG